MSLPLPEPLIIDDDLTTPFLYPRDKRHDFRQSWDNGGVALSNPNEGLTKYVWHCYTDGQSIYLKRDDVNDWQLILTDSNISEVDFTFDQNMRACLVWVANGLAKMQAYDSVSQSVKITEYRNIKNPRVSLDDKRKFNIANSDIIFGYVRDGNLCYRLQRERYTIEHILATDARKNTLVRIGMGRKLRFMFDWREVLTPTP